MYKRNAQGWYKHIDFILWDVFILQASFVLGYMIKDGWGNWPYLRDDYRSLAIILAVADFLVAILFNTMHNVLKRGKVRELTETLRHVVLVLMLMSLYLFSTKIGNAYSRMIIYFTSGFHFIFGYSSRLLLKPLIRRLNRGMAKRNMILVAEECSVRSILERCRESSEGFEYSGLVLSDRDACGETIDGISVVANIDNAAEYICREWVDEVFVYPEHMTDLKTAAFENIDNFMSNMEGEQKPGEYSRPEDESGVGRLIEQCREMAIPVHIKLPIPGGTNFVEKIGGYNVLTMAANLASPMQLLLKRVMDILGGAVGSLAALLVIAVIGPKIKKESPGPILFKQIRVGKNGKRFVFYKIRSMYMDAEARKKELMEQNRVSDGMMFKLDFDPRIIGNRIVDGKQVTGIGEKIRSSSLDEFPQFFNVLKGDMSLVGTRPPTEDEWERYKYHHRARLAIKPGITGMWQVSGRSQITDFEEVVKLDTEYINNWSIGLDVRILLKTVRTVLRREGAM